MATTKLWIKILFAAVVLIAWSPIIAIAGYITVTSYCGHYTQEMIDYSDHSPSAFRSRFGAPYEITRTQKWEVWKYSCFEPFSHWPTIAVYWSSNKIEIIEDPFD